jgi:opacity protein-like surface antigen
MGGVGVGYTFFDHLQVRADYAYYMDIGEERKTLETDISTVTVGVAYRF